MQGGQLGKITFTRPKFRLRYADDYSTTQLNNMNASQAISYRSSVCFFLESQDQFSKN